MKVEVVDYSTRNFVIFSKLAKYVENERSRRDELVGIQIDLFSIVLLELLMEIRIFFFERSFFVYFIAMKNPT